MVLRYFRKSENPPVQDANMQDEVETQNQPDKNLTTDDCSLQSRTANSTGLRPSTEVSFVDAEGQIERPILTDDDETFLRRVVSEEEAPPPLPPRHTPTSDQSQTTDLKQGGPDAKRSAAWKDRWAQYWDARNNTNAANDLMAAAEALKAKSEGGSDNESEVKHEQKDVKSILSRLDLSAINNRVVGVSNDTQKLLESFNQVLKDIINGVPTAYDDLEKLLKDRQNQLDKLFGSLPPYLQKLVKSLPTKMYASFAPQIALAMSSRKSAENETSDKGESKESEDKPKKKKLLRIPTLKELVTQKGVVVGMLRSIVSFLETRFPMMLTGTNVIMSLSVFVLLFVFWYCHKRGRETRLAKESSESLENSASDLESATVLGDGPDGKAAESEGVYNEADDETKQKIDLLADEIEKKP